MLGPAQLVSKCGPGVMPIIGDTDAEAKKLFAHYRELPTEQLSAVIEIDRRTVGDGAPGPLTRKLQDLYFGACKGEDDRYASWLTPIV